MSAADIVRRAWQELPRGDRKLLEAIRANQWRLCGRALGTYADELLASAGSNSLPPKEISRANDALALWIPALRVVTISLASLGTKWGHALSLDRAEHDDIAAGERYVELLPAGLAKLVREAGYRPREYTHEVVAEVYSILMARRRLGQTRRPPWLHMEVY